MGAMYKPRENERLPRKRMILPCEGSAWRHIWSLISVGSLANGLNRAFEGSDGVSMA